MGEVKDSMDRVAGNRNALEELMLRIPGFKGYLKREYMRESDKVHRDYVAQRLANAKKSVSELASDLVDEGRLESLEMLDRIQDKLDKVVSRVTYSDQGYSGAFDTIKMDDRAIETLHQIDLALVNFVVEIEDVMKRLGTGLEGDAMKKAVKDVYRKIDQFDEKMDQREHVVTGVI